MTGAQDFVVQGSGAVVSGPCLALCVKSCYWRSR
jgi:hypothetical protein